MKIDSYRGEFPDRVEKSNLQNNWRLFPGGPIRIEMHETVIVIP